jgi:hypothetical protein
MSSILIYWVKQHQVVIHANARRIRDVEDYPSTLSSTKARCPEVFVSIRLVQNITLQLFCNMERHLV